MRPLTFILILNGLIAAAQDPQLAHRSASSAEQSDNWRSLFDGSTLRGWRETPFTGRGSVRVENGAVVLAAGEPMTGITYGGDVPTVDYEIRFEASKAAGGDFFSSVTFPVDTAFCTWVLGGWGGDIVGISSVDGWDASENETRTYFSFEPTRWYRFRLAVTAEKITGFIDDAAVTVLNVNGRSLSLRHGEIKLSVPLGFASFRTTGMVRKVEIRTLKPRP
jgi:hypothetical protein